MRSTRFSSLKLVTCLAVGLVASTTGCKMGSWGSSWNPSAYVWNPMKMWKSDAPPASSLASSSAATKPSTQVPTSSPVNSIGARTSTPAATSTAANTGANTWATNPPPVYTAGAYGGATAPPNATAGYPATTAANGYPTQPATGYGTPNQPGAVAPAAGYGAGQYGMATPAGGAPQSYAGGNQYQPTYTAAAQPGYQQPSPYQQQPAATGYQGWQGYQGQAQPQPSYATPPADQYQQYNNPAAGYQTPAYNPPANNGGYQTNGYIQGGYNGGASTQAPAAAGGYASATPNNGYDAAPAAAAAPANAPADYATAYQSPAANGPEVSGVTTGAPAVPASLASAGGYRPGSTGRDTGVANAGYNQPSTGYSSSGGTTYR